MDDNDLLRRAAKAADLPQRLRENAELDAAEGCDPDVVALEMEAADRIERLEREVEVLYIERNHARLHNERLLKILAGIHAVMLPPDVTRADGQVMEFRNPDIEHQWFRGLCERIRAIPEEIDRVAAALGGDDADQA